MEQVTGRLRATAPALGDAGYFCPPGSTTPRQKQCGSIMALTEDQNTFHETSSTDSISCLLHQLPEWPIQFVEFALLDLSNAEHHNPTNWDLTKQRREIVNRLTAWDFSRKAWLSSGDGSAFVESGWIPGRKSKTSCMWKMFATENVYGLDGVGHLAGGSDAFLYGTKLSFRDRIFVASGTQEGSYADGHDAVMINKNEWVFYCVASTGDLGHTEAYVATPADDGRELNLVWEQNNNLEDNGSNDPRGMIFGKESNAYYGGFYHWDDYLNHEKLQELYKLLSRFYPGKL